MRIGMVSHWYDPEGGAAAGPGTIARALRDRGHDIDVVTGFPIYPAGRVFDGYRLRPYQRELMRGVTVHRSPIYPSHDTRASRRAANYLSFAASGSAVALGTLRRSDVVFVYSTPATAAIPGLALRAVHGLPLVVQVQDLWPDSVTSSGFIDGARQGRAERVLHRFCDAVYRRADRIAVTSPGMAGLLAARGVPADKLAFIPNWAEESSFFPRPADSGLAAELGPFRTFTVMYAGNFGELQGLETVVEAAQRLRSERDIGFALVGGGVLEAGLRRRVDELRLDNVQFVPAQPFSRMSEVLALGDAQLISLKDVPLLRSTLPSKLQANLAVGKPLIGAVTGDAAAVITSSGSGVVAAPGNADELAAAILRVARSSADERAAMGARARAYYLAHFSERVVGDRLSELLESVAGRRGRG